MMRRAAVEKREKRAEETAKHVMVNKKKASSQVKGEVRIATSRKRRKRVQEQQQQQCARRIGVGVR